MTTSADLVATLEDLGCRRTAPRQRLADAIASKGGTFSAEEVLGEVGGIGRATVFRTLRLLLDAGVLCKTTLPDGSPRYSLDDPHHHHHAMCVRCGQVSEFRHAAVERMLRTMQADVAGEIVGHRLELYVVCGQCSDAT